MELDIKLTGFDDVKSRLNINPRIKKKILTHLSRYVVRQSKNRIAQQTDLNNQKFAARSDRSNKKKMLLGLKRELRRVKLTNEQATIGWYSEKTAKIAAKHQYGHVQSLIENSNGRIRSDHATRNQAKALREVGYKAKFGKRKSLKTPTIKWIAENLTIGQAGFLILTLRNEVAKTEIVIPKRSFLGANKNDINEMNLIAIEDLKNALGKKNG